MRSERDAVREQESARIRAESVSAMLPEKAVERPDDDLFVLPRRLQDRWRMQRRSWRYREAQAIVDTLAQRYRSAGYGAGHRVALPLENRPDHFFHWLALNSLGAGIVPLNPDYGADEMRFALAHSDSVLAVTVPERTEQIALVARALGLPLALNTDDSLPPARTAPPGGPSGKRAEAALHYTSGTTGRPKGCLLSNEYFLGWGEWYAAQGGLIRLRLGQERLMQPLQTFHTNAMGNSFMGMLISGGAQVILDRFHPRSWWQDAVETRATCFHFLGVMPAMLLGLPPSPLDRAHGLRFGLGGGLRKAHHAAFEARFGVKLLGGWAMTETGGGGIICDAYEPRLVGTHCIGRPDRPGPPMEIRIVDDDDHRDVAPGASGEMLVRARGPNPRRRFFSGYLKDEAATEAVWKGGWLNTGDIVREDEAGNLYFVDRKKSIVRRSGENIATAEVEEMLAAHGAVQEAAVLGVPDEIRGEEVMAVLVLRPGHTANSALAEALFEHCRARFAYYKVPGYIAFVREMPVTTTQKVRKVDFGDLAEHPGRHPNCFDLRTLKHRSKARPNL